MVALTCPRGGPKKLREKGDFFARTLAGLSHSFRELIISDDRYQLCSVISVDSLLEDLDLKSGSKDGFRESIRSPRIKKREIPYSSPRSLKL